MSATPVITGSAATKYYYADAENKTAGPVTEAELQVLIRDWVLKADPMVVPEGGSEWRPLSQWQAQADSVPSPAVPRQETPQRAQSTPVAFVTSATPERANSQRQIRSGGALAIPLPVSPTLPGDLVAAQLGRVSGWLSEQFVARSLAIASEVGHITIFVGGVLGLVYAIYYAVKNNSLQPLVGGVIFAVAVAIAQFTAQRFLGAADALIKTTPHHVSSKSFFECYGLYALLAAIGLLLSAIFAAVQANTVLPILFALSPIAFLVYSAALAFHPQAVNIEIGEGSTGEEAVGLCGFFLKALLKLVPLFFCLCGIAGAVVVIMALFGGSEHWLRSSGLLYLLPYGLWEVVNSFAGLVLVLFACLIPILAYVLFLVMNVLLELARSILVLPGKFDQKTPSDA